MRHFRRIFALALVLAVFAPSFAGSAELKKDGQDALSKGVSLYKKGDLMAARSAFKSVLRNDPRNETAQGYVNRIDRYFQKVAVSLVDTVRKIRGRREKELANVLSLQPDDPDAEKLVFEALDGILDENSQKDLEWLLAAPPSGLVRVSSETLKKEMKFKSYLADRESKKVYQQAMAMFQRGQREQALRKFEDVLELKPADKAASQMVETIRAQVARERSEKVDSLYREAADLYTKGDLPSAAQRLKEILALEPEHSEARRYLGKIQDLQTEKEKRIYEK